MCIGFTVVRVSYNLKMKKKITLTVTDPKCSRGGGAGRTDGKIKTAKEIFRCVFDLGGHLFILLVVSFVTG